MTAYQQLEAIFAKLSHLNHLRAIASWDEATMMPVGGGPARAQAIATLEGISHETLTQPRVGDLIEQAKHINTLDAWQRANLDWMEKKYVASTCLPTKLVEQLTETSITCEQSWRQLRAQNNWHDFVPQFNKLFSLIKESATIRAEIFHLDKYDVLIDQHSPGINQTNIDPIFAKLKQELPPLIEKIISQQQKRPPLQPQGPFAIEKQKNLGIELMQAIGFDFNHGRLDTSHHPFCGGVPSDVRITTRYREDEFISALMGICHETGHAMYEQNLPKKWSEQPVGDALGMTMHESQSLLMEMEACRSQEFMQYLAPKLKHYFGANPAFIPENLFQLYTQVKRSLIRVDADEVTYPLHVILRYEIERDLFAEKITINDLPEVWNEKMTSYLGLSTKDNYKNGVMQDVHWPSGAFGYFPAYTLGRLIAAQLFASATHEHLTILPALASGDFKTLNNWLRANVHAHGSSIDSRTLLKQATGSDLNPDFFLRHIQKRYLAE